MESTRNGLRYHSCVAQCSDEFGGRQFSENGQTDIATQHSASVQVQEGFVGLVAFLFQIAGCKRMAGHATVANLRLIFTFQIIS